VISFRFLPLEGNWNVLEGNWKENGKVWMEKRVFEAQFAPKYSTLKGHKNK